MNPDLTGHPQGTPAVPGGNRKARGAICGASLVLGIVIVSADLPAILLLVPVVIGSFGLLAGPGEAAAAWLGFLSPPGICDSSSLTDADRDLITGTKQFFWLGETICGVLLAGIFSIPAGIFLGNRTDPALAFAGAALLFLPLFVFLPRLIRYGMKADAAAITGIMGKNEQVRRVFWAVFLALAGLVLARIVDPVTAQQIIAALAGL